MAIVYLALGSNLGDRMAHLQTALAALDALLVIERVSSVYETAAAYVDDQPSFFNAVLRGTTNLAPHDLLAETKRIERDGGRTAGIRFGPRPIDLDILHYDELILDSPDLVLPHPRIAERAFVLRPLAEIAPQLVPPDVLAQAEIGAVLAVVGALR